MTDTPETIKGEDIIFCRRLFTGTADRKSDGRRDVIIGLVSPIVGTRYAYSFGCTGDALEFCKDLADIIHKIDMEEAKELLGTLENEEAESNASGD